METNQIDNFAELPHILDMHEYNYYNFNKPVLITIVIALIVSVYFFL